MWNRHSLVPPAEVDACRRFFRDSFDELCCTDELGTVFGEERGAGRSSCQKCDVGDVARWCIACAGDVSSFELVLEPGEAHFVEGVELDGGSGSRIGSARTAFAHDVGCAERHEVPETSDGSACGDREERAASSTELLERVFGGLGNDSFLSERSIEVGDHEQWCGSFDDQR